jgi:hypothetical protein
MDRLISLLRSRPIFFLLLPLFFVFHGFTENFYAIPVRDASWLLLLYILAALILFFAGRLLYRDRLKAAVLSFCIMAFHFFFGGLQDLLKNWMGDAFITRYSFLLPFFFIFFILLITFLKKRKLPLTTISFYLNILLCIFILIDCGWLISKSFSRRRPAMATMQTINCDSCMKPDIYFMVFDEYSSSTALKELWNYDNSGLDSFLTQKGFELLPYSRSNYNFTEFSIASTLNMDWVEVADPKACTVKDYNHCFELIKNNRVTHMLQSAGYKICNYSIFDIGKNPSPVHESFLPLKTKLITSQTFLSRIRKDIFFHLLAGKFELKWLSKDLIYSTKHSNEEIIDAMLKESRETASTPKFVYSHIEMPHPPFYYDKNGNERDKQKLVEETKKPVVQPYLDYLPATNKVIRQLVTSIFDHAKRPVVIIIIGDHGYRADQPQEYYFRNLNAVFTPGKNYQGFSHSITNVNEFRTLFNNLFHLNHSLLKDSTVFLTDK